MSTRTQVDTFPARKRHRYRDAYRHKVVTEIWRGGASVAEVARRHNLNANHVETACRGTLLLDEIGDLPPALQVQVLRFLETGRIRWVGGNTEIQVDVRVLAATHVDLDQAVADGGFREDLYHRLNVVFLRVPPQRERLEDIEQLAQHFSRHFARERTNTHMQSISPEALQRMAQHDWPGNVRELNQACLEARG